jgi:hypothetical protein
MFESTVPDQSVLNSALPLPQPEINPAPEIVYYKENPFHQMLAKRCIEWVTEQINQGKNPRKEIFRPPDFDGNWSKVRAADYFLHRLSILGLPAETSKITAEYIGQTLSQHSERVTSRNNVLSSAYNNFNAASEQFGLSAGNFDPNRLYFLDSSRVAEISGKTEHNLAYTLDGNFGEIIIPNDDKDLNQDPNQLYDVIVHELGHQTRKQMGLDQNISKLREVLEEGIVQQHARNIEQRNGKASPRTDESDMFEAEVVQHLSKALGVESLIGMSHEDIRKHMREKYLVPGQLLGDPYDDLIYDMNTFNRKLDTFASLIESNDQITSEQIMDMKQGLKLQKDSMYRQWKFT